MSMMRSICLFIAFLALFAPSFAQAQTSIGVVDLQKILIEADVAKSVQTQTQSYRERFQGEVTAMEDDLRDMQKLLSNENSGLTAEQLTAKKQEFEKKLASTRNAVEKKKRALDEGFTKAMEQLRAEVIEVVAAVADEKGYQLVLTRENVVLVEKAIDITVEVMDKLNATAKPITVEVKE